MKLKLIFITVLVSALSFAQESKIKFGKVSQEEVLQTEHHLDKEAEAAVLYKKERLYYDYDGKKGFRTIRDVHLRIKIYKKTGLGYATVQVPLYASRSGEEKIGQIKGYTFNSNGSKIDEVKLKKEGVFRENLSKYLNLASITMPEVKEGSVIDLSYQVLSYMTGYMADFTFQYGIPVNHVDVSVEIPEYFVFKQYTKGYYPIVLEQSNKTRKLTVQYREERNETTALEFAENTYTVKVDDIPALKNVDFTDNIDNYRSAITFELAYTEFPNSAPKNYSQTWADVASAINSYDDFGPELAKTSYFKADIDKISSKVGNSKELALHIFEFVKNRMNWNGYSSFWSENGVKKAYEEQTGNVGDINLMLTSMLRYAGLKANPVLVSSKTHGIPLFPTTNGFNYVIAAIEQNDGSLVLLDATEKSLAFNMLPNRAMNWSGRLVREDGSSINVPLVTKQISKKITFVSAKLADNGSVSGQLRNQNIGHFAYSYRTSLESSTTNGVGKALEDKYSGLEIENLEIKNLTEVYKPIVESYSYIKDNEIELIGDKIYFRPALFLFEGRNPFKLDERQFPIDFEFPKSEKITINITIPKGFKVEAIPEKMTIGLPDGLGKFTYDIKPLGDMLQFSCTKEINKSLIPPNYYASLKEFYNQMLIKHNEKVVLSKI